jgi:hypothetical protein
VRTWAIFACACLLVGCMTAPQIPQTVMNRLTGGLQGPDVIVVDVATLEQPIADPYIDSELWTSVDEQAIALDCKAGLDDNGFRIGVIGGMPAPRLQELLTSDRWCKAHRVSLRSGHGKTIAVGPAQSDCSFELHASGEKMPRNFAQAQFGMSLTPVRTQDGRVRLAIKPQVELGKRILWVAQAEGESETPTGQHHIEKFSDLAFEVTISPQEYLLIGTRYDHPGTLSNLMFMTPQATRPMQRLLVIRARPQSEAAKHPWQNDSAAPLAYQASRAARGTKD